MSTKQKTISLSHPHRNPDPAVPMGTDYAYRVEKITDSVDYYPGQILTRKEVESLCAAKDWRVTVAPNKA